MNKNILIILFAGIGLYLTMKNKTNSLPSGGMTDKEITDTVNLILRRGERLNNPANIEKSANQWQGLAPAQPDSRFASFVSPDFGIRALVKILNTYYYKYNLNTISKILNRYAPPVENDTNSYAKQVALNSGIGINTPFAFNQENIFKIAKAMIKHEQGRVIYPDAVIRYGVSLGFA